MVCAMTITFYKCNDEQITRKIVYLINDYMVFLRITSFNACVCFFSALFQSPFKRESKQYRPGHLNYAKYNLYGFCFRSSFVCRREMMKLIMIFNINCTSMVWLLCGKQFARRNKKIWTKNEFFKLCTRKKNSKLTSHEKDKYKNSIIWICNEPRVKIIEIVYLSSEVCRR